MTRTKQGRPGLLTFDMASEADAEALARLRTAVADRLTQQYGQGHWSLIATEKGVIHGMKDARVLVARSGGRMVGTLRLATRKPWAIDPAYFTEVRRPLYLTDMAVDPQHQRQGIGRQLMEEAIRLARAWPADSIRLDAYDAEAGAGEFYAKCGLQLRGRTIYRSVPLLYYEYVLTPETSPR
jgi:GNAT superfamily N-acetyltransferase